MSIRHQYDYGYTMNHYNDLMKWYYGERANTVPTVVEECPGNDPTCPGHDHGDPCHYLGNNPTHPTPVNFTTSRVSIKIQGSGNQKETDVKNQRFNAVLETMQATHDSKNEDYAEAGNPYSNFEKAAEIAGITVQQQFASLVGVKIARLTELVSGKTPNHESLDDTLLDLSVYAAIWLSYRQAEAAGSQHD